jgi:hypothetical protein
MAAIDSRPSSRRWDSHPRVARKAKPKPVTLGDDAAQVMLFYGIEEKTYREKLFVDLCRFCRQNGGWVISPSHQGRAVIQMAEGSPLLELLAQWPRYPVAILPGTSHRLTHGKFVPVTEIQVTLWR